MTVVQLVIVPGILLGAFLAAIVFVVARLAAVKVRASRAVLHCDAAWLAQYRHYGDVVASVIAEMETRPATYSTVPAELRDALYSAHSSARELERKSH